MKRLLGIFVCLVIASSLALAQQEAPPKPPPLSIQPTAEALMKAQATADKTQKQSEASIEELKKFVEREIAKSAALPITTTVQEPIKAQPLPFPIEVRTETITLDGGGVYLRIGNIVVPMPGSECFLPENEVQARRLRANAKLAEKLKAESGKKD